MPIVSTARAGRIGPPLRVGVIVMDGLIFCIGVVFAFFTAMAACAKIAGNPENEDCDDEAE